MALRLVRETSDTPNITNKDDVRMIRYAYGGYNGVLKDYGSELDYEISGSSLRIRSGRIAFQGWEIDLDEAGWLFDVSNIQGVQYNSIYLEIDVSIESVEIKSTFLTGQYPTIEQGDDLTKAPNGKARFMLYNVKVENGTITEVIKKVEVVPYLPDVELKIDNKITSLSTSLVTGAIVVKKTEIAQYATSDKSKGTIEDRLTKLGFKSGVITFSGVNYGSTAYLDTTRNGIYRLGNFVFCRIAIQNQTIKLTSNPIGTIPQNFRPKQETYFTIGGYKSSTFGAVIFKIATTGVITQVGTVGNVGEWVLNGFNNVYINFGYEAPSIT